MLRNLVTALLEHERVETTAAKAKALRRTADRMVTLGKRGSLHARRQALAFVRDPEIARKLFGELAERYLEREGGYTRIIKTRIRTGDAAQMALVELVDAEFPEEEMEEEEEAAAAAEADETEEKEEAEESEESEAEEDKGDEAEEQESAEAETEESETGEPESAEAEAETGEPESKSDGDDQARNKG